jgi:predicted RNA-binding protein (virulence factor B family)
MIKLGKIQTLYIVKKVEFGVYLNSEKGVTEGSILLPIKQVPRGSSRLGDAIEVFVYRDSKDRMIATVNRPLITMGQIAPLKVADVTKIGAFMDWGLEKDLFLPYKEQTTRVEKGKTYLVRLYIDKSDRLCATMKLYGHLSSDSPYQVDDHVTGMVYELSDNFGAFVAVDNQYDALIKKQQLFSKVQVGDIVEARVVKIHNGGKLDLNLRKKAYKQMDDDSHLILDALEKNNGILKLHDKSNPEDIKRELGMSKNGFKRAVGRLLKAGKIELGEEEIRLK